MSDVIIVMLIVYPCVAVLCAMVRWIEWNDNNILRIALIGAGWPIIIFWYCVRAGRAVSRYFRGRLWVELAEIAPRPVRELRPPQDTPREYEAGQWRD